ncbi:unnamed protein product [Owenia fusiformis]|uniref:Autophagy-related protein 2 n=1 Tax=Owenia fusiformis TaxID=6347 RepID=A0A8S4PH68_OWEFU|nr:unnamed protein product [Owenia fusiformis]
MPWYFPWSDSIKKRACRYLLQHYVGQFLKEKLSLDQLSIDIYNGTGTIEDVLLDVCALNEALDSHNVPVQIVDGFIGKIQMTIPWSALVNDSTLVEIHGMEITIQPKQRNENDSIMIDSMFSSMTTSIQLAQECLKQPSSEGEKDASGAQPFEGLENFAQTIESVLSKIRVNFTDTIIRMEHLPLEAEAGVALEVRIKRIEYFDDMVNDDGTPVDQMSNPQPRSIYEPAAIAHKNFHLMGVTIFSDEFPKENRTFSRQGSSSPSQYEAPKGFDADEGLSPVQFHDPHSQNQQQFPHPHETGHAPYSAGHQLPTHSTPIRIATCAGKQELKLKVKQNEALAGPKLEVDVLLGSVNVFLSPRQVHILLELANGITAPSTSDDTNIRHKKAHNKPMMSDDYEKIEQELQHHLEHDVHSAHDTRPLGDDALTTQSLDDSDDDEEFYYSIGQSHPDTFSDMESSISSSVSSKSASTTTTGGYRYTPGNASYFTGSRDAPFQTSIPREARKPRHRKKDTLQKLLDDPASELTRYKLKLSYFSLVVLHEDPPPTPSDAIDPGKSSEEKLLEMSEVFFGKAQGINAVGIDLCELRELYSEACPHDHLGIIGKPLTLECNQTSTIKHHSTTLDITIGMLEAVECLFDRRAFTHSLRGFSLPIDNILPEYSELLVFLLDVGDVKTSMYGSLHSSASPCVKLRMQSIESSNQNSRRNKGPPKTSINLELGRIKSELDVTIVDRIHALLNPSPLSQHTSGRGYMSNAGLNMQSCFSQALDENPSGSDRITDLHITSPMATINVRFPIPDLRTGQGIDKMPWWRRSLRKEVLILELSDLDFQTSYQTSETTQKYEFICKDAHGLFQEAPSQPPISFARISPAKTDDFTIPDKGFDWPRIVIKMFPKNNSVLEDDTPQIDDTGQYFDSLNGACQFTKKDPSPFSAKKVIHEGDEMVIPGDKKEIQEFVEKSISNTLMTIDITLPNVNAVFPTKAFYELLYNRINNDLLMWEALAPSPLTSQGSNMHMQPPWGLDLATQLMSQDAHRDRFIMCRSALQYESSSDSESSDEHGYTIMDQKQKQQRKRRAERRQQQSKLCVSVAIAKGKLTCCSPLKDSEGKVLDDCHGEFLLDIIDGSLFAVTAYNGNPELRYVCIQSNKASLYHNGCVMGMQDFGVIDRAFNGFPSHLDPTIYLSDPGVATKLSGTVGTQGESMDMLTVALKINLDTFRNIKEFLVAVGVKSGTLKHKMYPTGQSWFTQCLDFLDVIDQPILGYTQPEVVTELHCHLWSCAVDYRPLFLPHRAMIVVEHFSVSSNICANSPTSLLRFIIDDGAIFMSNKCNSTAVNLKNNYVCVVDVGLFELSLKTSDGKDTRYPKTELRASNNVIHIRTCADSCQALQEMIVYFANDGDLTLTKPPGESTTSCQTNLEESEESISDSPVTDSHMETVHDMMADAMLETSPKSQTSGQEMTEGDQAKPSEIFFFPDEATKHTSPNMGVSHDQTSLETSISASPYQSERSSDEEFCVIDDPGLGITSKDGEPTIRKFCDDPISIKDNYFTMPMGKTDQLKAPEHFPSAVYRYTLKEMSLVWCMYGGSDFGDKDSLHRKKVKHNSPIRYSNQRSDPITIGHNPYKGSGDKLGWQARGGPGRDIDTLMELHLNKVRMQFETFPEHTEQASRQILLINEVEIRDRIGHSQINKFLYQYASETCPRQSHANMVVIKALHVRPNPKLAPQECSLKVALLPLRLNVDQDALMFFRQFFSSLTGKNEDDSSPTVLSASPPDVNQHQKTPPTPRTPPTKSLPPMNTPIMMVGEPSPDSPQEDPQEFLIQFDEMQENMGESANSTDDVASHDAPVYFKCFVFSPDVPIRLDYTGKRIDFGHGTFAGLIVGLAQLNCSELRLKRLNHRHGLLGYDKLLAYCLNEWLSDIKKNQLPSILGGVGPMHSLVQLVQGLKDLFWLPVEQYKKDGRIVRGLQRGAHSFTTSTAMAALELTNRLVQSIQYCAEFAFDMVSPGPSVTRRKRIYRRKHRVLQPADLREGVTNAYHLVREGISETAQTMMQVAKEENEQKGVTGAVGGVLRQLPGTVVQPIILATEATSNVLGGMRNQLLPDARKEETEKWKKDS